MTLETKMEEKEALFRQKAKSYLCCFNDSCPLHDHCLRWEAGQYYDSDLHVATCISPRYQAAVDGHCDQYRNDQRVTMPVGMMTRFYHDMPAHTAKAIKRRLIAHTCRATYYKYHRGDRPITPDYLAVIQRICREEGWQRPLMFDAEVTDYVW